MPDCRLVCVLFGIFTLGALGFYVAVLRHFHTLIEMDRKIQESQRKIDEQIAAEDRLR